MCVQVEPRQEQYNDGGYDSAPARRTCAATRAARIDDRATWMDDVDSEQPARQRWSPLCAQWATVTGARLGCRPALLGFKNRVGPRARSDWAVTTTPNVPKAWPQPNLEVPLYERLPHAGSLASKIHPLLRTARRVPGQGISSPYVVPLVFFLSKNATKKNSLYAGSTSYSANSASWGCRPRASGWFWAT